MEEMTNYEAYKEIKRTWQKWMLPFVIPVLLLFAFLVGRNIGFEKTIEKTMTANIFTEDRQMIATEVTLEATYTHYPLDPDKTNRADTVDVIVDGRTVAMMLWDRQAPEQELRPHHGNDWTMVMTADLEMLLVEQEFSRVYPEEARQRCVIVAPEMTLEETLAQIATMDEDTQARFSWLWTLMDPAES